jgi:hypothetical protein
LESICDPDRWIVKSEKDILDDCATPGSVPARPYWDPVLAHNGTERAAFLGSLHRASLLSWRRRARSVIGCFFVGKKDGVIRLVVDARIPNASHRRPPHASLAVPGALARILLSDEAIVLGNEN